MEPPKSSIRPSFRRASRCEALNQTGCVEVASTPDTVLLRDSTDRGGPVMTLSRDEGLRFVRLVRRVGNPTLEGAAVAVTLPCDESAPSLARRLVRGRLAHHPEDVVDVVELCTSETVTNAVVHSGTEPLLVMVETDKRIRVEVLDGGGRWDSQNESTALDAEDGRGLFIVREFSSTFGVYEDSEGKNVWFEVSSSGL